MKFPGYLQLVLAFLLIAIGMDAAERVVRYPSYYVPVKENVKPDKKQKTEFRIVEVSASPEKTVISCEIVIKKKNKASFYIDSDCALYYNDSDSVSVLRIKGAENIEICCYNPGNEKVYVPGEKLEFKLFFAPLPEGLERFDFIETVFSSWNCVDISLEQGGTSEEEQMISALPFGDVMSEPGFQGQDKSFFSKWVTSHLVYPERLRQEGIQGRLKMMIEIGTDGEASYGILEKSYPEFNAEAMRVVSMAPEWSPAVVRGMPVSCHMTFPVVFVLATVQHYGK